MSQDIFSTSFAGVNIGVANSVLLCDRGVPFMNGVCPALDCSSSDSSRGAWPVKWKIERVEDPARSGSLFTYGSWPLVLGSADTETPDDCRVRSLVLDWSLGGVVAHA